jgi:hypothetical protein
MDNATLAVPLVDNEVVQRIRAFCALGWSLMRIARRIARNSLRRCVRQRRAAELATVRFETAPGHQRKVDFEEACRRAAGLRPRRSADLFPLGVEDR